MDRNDGPMKFAPAVVIALCPVTGNVPFREPPVDLRH
jgi:hypothetical protein